MSSLPSKATLSHVLALGLAALVWPLTADAEEVRGPAPAASLVPDARQVRQAPVTVLVTHPRAHTLHFFDTLVRAGVWKVDNLHLVGIYHAAETEDYTDAQAYIREHGTDWITLHRVQCQVTAQDMYAEGPCRAAFADLVSQSSGIVFNGGPDIPPVFYRRQTLLTTVIESPHRHVFELSLLFHLLGGRQNPRVRPLLADRPDFPILGICVGMQSMAVAAGGALVQDIPSEIYGVHTEEALLRLDENSLHRNVFRILNPGPDVAVGVFHRIKLTGHAPASLLRGLVRTKDFPKVLSLHHQAVAPKKGMGLNYEVTATSFDGRVIEGMHHTKFPHVWGWQFHPERSLMWDAKELERRREGDPAINPAVEMLAKEPVSNAFNRGVWALFAEDVVRASATQK